MEHTSTSQRKTDGQLNFIVGCADNLIILLLICVVIFATHGLVSFIPA